jgi:tungstate transport system substrate-binding protein
VFAVVLLATAPAKASDPFIILASTTSTANSGLLDFILPRFEKQAGFKVRVVVVGTGQALRIARNGDADVLLVHHRPSEEKFVAEGYGVKRYDVMYNDFVIVGPEADPAGAARIGDAFAAMKRIAQSGAVFVSRGDDSGTHRRELTLWRMAGIDIAKVSGSWYRETGAGMGATLNTTFAMNAYTLADRGTWISFRNRAGLAVMIEGEPPLFNPYGIILVNPQRHPHIKGKMGQRLIDWMISAQGQEAIAAFRIGGEQLFKPNARLNK